MSRTRTTHPRVVTCARKGCGATGVSRLVGTMPKDWCARYIRLGHMPRYCCQACMDASKGTEE